MCKALEAALELQDHYLTADALLGLAKVFYVLGRAAEAKTAIRDAGVIMCRHYGEDNLQVAESLFVLGEVTKLRGKYRDARVIYSRCISIRCKTLPLDHPSISEALHAAADNLRLVGYFEAAADPGNEAYNGRVNRFGERNIFSAKSLIMKAQLMSDIGYAFKAEPYFQEALYVIRDQIGWNNGLFAMGLIELAECSRRQSKMELAELVLNQAISLVNEHFGAHGLVAMQTYERLAWVLYGTGKPEAALALLQRDVLPRYEEILGRTHPNSVNTRGMIGLCMNAVTAGSGQQLIDTALKFFDEYGQFAFSSDHPWVLALGGYRTELATARTANSIEETSVATWAMPGNVRRADYGQMPNEESVSVSYASMESWGSVYFGKDTPTYQKVFNRLPDVRSTLARVIDMDKLGSSEDILKDLSQGQQIKDRDFAITAILGVYGDDEVAMTELDKKKQQRLLENEKMADAAWQLQKLDEERLEAEQRALEMDDRRRQEEQSRLALEAAQEEKLEQERIAKEIEEARKEEERKKREAEELRKKQEEEQAAAREAAEKAALKAAEEERIKQERLAADQRQAEELQQFTEVPIIILGVTFPYARAVYVYVSVSTYLRAYILTHPYD